MSLNIELLIVQLHCGALGGMECTSICSAFGKRACLPPTALLRLVAMEMSGMVSFLGNFALEIQMCETSTIK